MHVSRFPLFTVKEIPADAEIVSHQLMLLSLIHILSASIRTASRRWTGRSLLIFAKTV